MLGCTGVADFRLLGVADKRLGTVLKLGHKETNRFMFVQMLPLIFFGIFHVRARFCPVVVSLGPRLA